MPVSYLALHEEAGVKPDHTLVDAAVGKQLVAAYCGCGLRNAGCIIEC